MRQGLSKQDRMNHFGTKIFVPSFSGNKKFDPYRTLVFFCLIRTEQLRKFLKGKDETKLFLSLNVPH